MKEKIKGLSHTENVFWMRVKPTPMSLRYIHWVLTDNGDYFGLGTESKEDFNPIYSNFINNDLRFFNDNECGYIIFTKTHINIILRKETRMFEKLKADFFKRFEMIKYNPKGKKKPFKPLVAGQ